MTDRPLSPKDLELLSAYLDNQLGDREVKRLETRLAQNAGLSATLEDLKRTRLMLRGLPKVRAPHNFTLSPKMVGEVSRPPRKFWQLSSSWAMVSAISVMLLMITLMGDLMGVFTPASLAASYAPDTMNLTTEMEAMRETMPEGAPEMALSAPLETPLPDEQTVLGTYAAPAADPVAPDTEEPGGLTMTMGITETARTFVDPMNKEAETLDASMENPEAPLPAENLTLLFTPAWVHVIESVLLGLAVATIALALYWQRKI